jgi:branched-chain amino acid transport system substrate-binding protein
MESGTDLVFRTTASGAYQGVRRNELAIAAGFAWTSPYLTQSDGYNAAIAAVFVETTRAWASTVRQ